MGERKLPFISLTEIMWCNSTERETMNELTYWLVIWYILLAGWTWDLAIPPTNATFILILLVIMIWQKDTQRHGIEHKCHCKSKSPELPEFMTDK